MNKQYKGCCLLEFQQAIHYDMGSDISRDKPPPRQQLRITTDPRYGGLAAIDRTNTKIYQTFDVDEASTQKFFEQIANRKELKHPALITVNRYWLQKYRESCSLDRRNRIIVEYIYMEKCLEDLIMVYCEKKMPYPQIELRHIFFDIVSCLLYLKKCNTCHGDIKPKNILFASNGTAFLADSYFINRGRVAYQIVMQDPQSLSLLSPEQLGSLRDKKFVSLKNIHKDQIFAIGLTMLEAMTAEPAMQCYDLANLQIKANYFDKKYDEMRSCGYSHQISSLVMACVDAPNKRPQFQDFLRLIQK